MVCRDKDALGTPLPMNVVDVVGGGSGGGSGAATATGGGGTAAVGVRATVGPVDRGRASGGSGGFLFEGLRPPLPRLGILPDYLVVALLVLINPRIQLKTFYAYGRIWN